MKMPGFDLHLHLAAMAPQFMDVRTTLPLQALAKASGVTISQSYERLELPRLSAEQPKIVILQRFGCSDAERYKEIVRRLVQRGWVIVAELDDHPDLLNKVHGREANQKSWYAVQMSHAVQTSTVDLANVFRSYNPKVAHFSNCAFRLAAPPARRQIVGDHVRVFFGALNREQFSARIGENLARMSARRSDLRFVVVHDRAFFEALGPANKEFHQAMPYRQFLSLMESCHIALMPLEGGVGEKYKSDVKFVEASSLGLASLASPVVYGGTILDGVTGLIVPELEGWSTTLEGVASDRERLVRIATAAHDYVGQKRLFSAQIADRLAWYRHLWVERIALTQSLSARLAAVS